MLDFSDLKKTRAGLTKAITTGDTAYLRRAFAKQYINVNFIGHDGNTPLHLAALTGNVAVARLMARQGASQHIKNKDGWFPIHLATFYGHMDLFMFLLDARNFEGQATLLVADGGDGGGARKKPICRKKSERPKEEERQLLLEAMSDDESDCSRISGALEVSQTCEDS